MTDPSAPTPGVVAWVLASAAAIVGALWAALRSTAAKSEARLEAMLAASENERQRERAEARDAIRALGARLDGERDGRRIDNERSARALLRARTGQGDPGEWEDDAPTLVRAILGAASLRPHERLLRAADVSPVESWSDATPPETPVVRRPPSKPPRPRERGR